MTAGMTACPDGDSRVSTDDVVDHPAHYTSHPSGVECITVTEHMGFNLGNAVKYIWCADLKNDAIEDLRKAVWYVNREIDRRTARTPAPVEEWCPANCHRISGLNSRGLCDQCEMEARS